MKYNVVYWAVNHRDPYFLCFQEPQKVLDLKKFKDLPDQENFTKCPSFLQEYKKTFNLVNPIDYDLYWSGDNMYSTFYDQKFFDDVVYVRSTKIGIASVIICPYIFFTESESCILTIGDAYYSSSNVTRNVSVISGSFDIGKWFRNIDFAFIFKEQQKNILMKLGEPYVGIKFDFGNNLPIKFKKFYKTDKLEELRKRCLNTKDFFNAREKFGSKHYFDGIYNLFYRSRVKKTILTEIKNNLME